MPNLDVAKTELLWPGKYNEDGSLRDVRHVNLPFQIIETVNESRGITLGNPSGTVPSGKPSVPSTATFAALTPTRPSPRN